MNCTKRCLREDCMRGKQEWEGWGTETVSLQRGQTAETAVTCSMNTGGKEQEEFAGENTNLYYN